MINSIDKKLIELMAQGLTMKEIASKMDKPACSIDTYRHRLYRKLGVLNGPHLIHWAHQNKILS